MFAPHSLSPCNFIKGKARRCNSSARTEKVREVRRTRSVVNLGRVGVEAFTKQTTVCSALSHDGLWVFANRIFADRVLADWRRRRWGRLPARQIGGSGNAQHGDEPSRYDYDGLHDANPLVLGTRTGRPSDAPIPLCLCKTPASTIPRSGSIARGMAPEYLSPRPVEWFKGNRQDQDSGNGIGRGAPTQTPNVVHPRVAPPRRWPPWVTGGAGAGGIAQAGYERGPQRYHLFAFAGFVRLRRAA
jgi:hypothetical protein